MTSSTQKVVIWYNHELEKPTWAVIVPDRKRIDESMWIDAFDNRDEAEEFCRDYSFEVIAIIEDPFQIEFPIGKGG